MPECPGYARHWFARYGSPGVVRAKCQRCGAPNPKWPALIRRLQRSGAVTYAAIAQEVGEIE